MSPAPPPSDATSPTGGGTPSSALQAGVRLAEFQIERVIGEGGFGIVYLARDTQLGRLVAVKEYMPSSLAGRHHDQHVTVKSERHRETFEMGRRSFINEARLLAHFDHPSLLKVLRFWEERGTAYMAMPYYKGQTLREVLREHPGTATEAWLRVLWQSVLEAMAHLHAEQCFHRDIAPDNIMLLPTGAPLLIDFGAARQVIGDATQALTVILKPGYAPIEQYAETGTMKQGAWTDIYAMGAVMYTAITGRPPPPSVARLVHDEMPRAVAAGQGRYSAGFLRVVDACLAVRPDQRPQSAADVLALLRAPDTPVPAGQVGDDDDERTVIIGAPLGSPSNTPVAVAGVGDDNNATVLLTAPAVAAPHTAAARASTAVPDREAAVSARRVPRGESAWRSRRVPKAFLASAAVLTVCGGALWWWLQQPVAPAAPQSQAVGSTSSARTGLTSPAAGGVGADGGASGGASGGAGPGTGAGVRTTTTTSAPAEAPGPSVASASTSLGEAGAVEPQPWPPRDGAGLVAHADTGNQSLLRAFATRAPGLPVEVMVAKTRLEIDKDAAAFEVMSRAPGYVYVLRGEPTAAAVDVLFPNAIDRDNRIDAGVVMRLPRAGWSMPTVGARGARQLLVVVSAAPRVFDSSRVVTSALPQNPSGWAGRVRCAGGVDATACDQRFGAALLKLDYVAPQLAARDPAANEGRSTGDGNPVAGGKTGSQTKAGGGVSAECVDLLTRASMGEDSAALRERMRRLNCR